MHGLFRIALLCERLLQPGQVVGALDSLHLSGLMLRATSGSAQSLSLAAQASLPLPHSHPPS